MNTLTWSGDISHNLGRPPLAVAVDKDKNSRQALRWAVDHLLVKAKSIVLIHVKTRQDPLNLTEACSEEPTDSEITQLFLPLRVYCASKGLLLMEVVLEDFDVSRAIIDYIVANNIQNIVVGSSNRNALRKFIHPDIPSYLINHAPDFCGVYVIHKGKPMTIRTARAQSLLGAPTSKQPLTLDSLQQQEEQIPERLPYLMRSTSKDAEVTTNDACVDIQDPRINFRKRMHVDVGFPEAMDFVDALEAGIVENISPCGPFVLPSFLETGAEMRRLRHELQQTKELYRAACKEAMMAKEMARKWQRLKMEEARKVEELKHSEEAALALVEIEKAKCKAALEAAAAAKKSAALETRRRYSAELRARRELRERKKVEESMLLSKVRYRKYTIEDIKIATKFFSRELKIGEGGYGPVFQAALDHTPVAIKVLRPDATQGRKQFQQEIEVLSCIRHPNMVLLLGACPEYGCLIYEYMDYGSLEDRLFRRGNTPPIPWTTRFKIAAEIATGLLFLHQAKPEPLVHRDLKPANILLDHNFVSKISDVGLARLVPPSVADSVTRYRLTATAGTLCYIDPEYQQTGMLGVKSDVYSLGIMLLQIITAKGPMALTHHVESAIENGTFADMLDPSLTDWPLDEALAYAKLALKCAELRRKDRPDLGKVILPELNKLRMFGQAYEVARRRNINSNHKSVMHQEQIIDSNLSEA